MKSLLLAGAGMLAGAALTLTTVGLPVQTAQAQADAHMMAMKAQIMAVTYQLDTSGLHALDEATHDGTIPAGSLGRIRKARIAVLATDWPAELREQAMSLSHHMMELEEALRAEDAARAAPHAKEIHDVAHDLSDAAYKMLGGQGGTPTHSPH